MNKKQNCWEFEKCGREKNGKYEDDLGVCPAAIDSSSNGFNDGINGGRVCWAVAGTLCGGEKQGTFAQKQISCMGCKFFSHVKEEQGTKEFKLMKPGQKYKR